MPQFFTALLLVWALVVAVWVALLTDDRYMSRTMTSVFMFLVLLASSNVVLQVFAVVARHGGLS